MAKLTKRDWRTVLAALNEAIEAGDSLIASYRTAWGKNADGVPVQNRIPLADRATVAAIRKEMRRFERLRDKIRATKEPRP